MDRRDLLLTLGAAAVTVTATALPSFAQHDHHHGGAANQDLIDASGNCSSKAEICQTHCQELLTHGDTSMAACLTSAREVATVCTALRSLAAQNAPSLPQFAKLAADVCKNCEAQCRQHETKHQACKDCANACAACRALCARAAAA